MRLRRRENQERFGGHPAVQTVGTNQPPSNRRLSTIARTQPRSVNPIRSQSSARESGLLAAELLAASADAPGLTTSSMARPHAHQEGSGASRPSAVQRPVAEPAVAGAAPPSCIPPPPWWPQPGRASCGHDLLGHLAEWQTAAQDRRRERMLTEGQVDTTERYNARLPRALATVHLQSIARGENRATLPPSYMSLR